LFPKISWYLSEIHQAQIDFLELLEHVRLSAHITQIYFLIESSKILCEINSREREALA
jgi:hypothetical protein